MTGGDPAAVRVLRRHGLRVLLVDNYDSFTHNLAQLCARLCGLPPEVVRNDALDVEALAARPPDAVLLSPGPGAPEVAADVGACPALVRRLTTTPILGVCLGHQVIAQVHGAAVMRAPRPMHGRLSRVRHDSSGLFAGLPDPLRVVRYHSLVVDAAGLPPALRVTAWTDEPEAGGAPGTMAARLPMALAHAERPLYGVQFHPESILTEAGEALLANFLDLAALHKTSGPAPAPRPLHDGTRRAPRATPARARLLRRDVPCVDPEQAFMSLHADAASAFWLDGNERFTYLGEAGRERVEVRGAEVALHGAGASRRCSGDPFAVLADLMLQRSIEPDDHYPFAAGYVGWLGYELKQFCEGGDGPRAPGALPDAMLLLADRTLAIDRVLGHARLFALVHAGQSEAEAGRWLDEHAARLAALGAAPAAPAAPPTSRPPAGARDMLRFHLDADRARYLERVARIHQLLDAGETYEICLTTQARARLPEGAPPLDALALHRVLRRSNPSPYGALLRFPGGAVVSASPERFVHLAPGGAIESRPIKGTRPRGRTPDEDTRLAADLATADKDRSENLMIVDLVRHDLGRVCAAGSVTVPALMKVEAHPAVFQLVSTVSGQLRPEVAAMEAVRALFPGGSMTGAPKIRAMRIIGELEGRPRGVYSGGLGALGFDGGVDLAMAIRTVVITEARGEVPGEISFGVGGAVVALSEAADEYEEALLKGRALAAAVARAAGCPLAPDDPFGPGADPDQ